MNTKLNRTSRFPLWLALTLISLVMTAVALLANQPKAAGATTIVGTTVAHDVAPETSDLVGHNWPCMEKDLTARPQDATFPPEGWHCYPYGNGSASVVEVTGREKHDATPIPITVFDPPPTIVVTTPMSPVPTDEPTGIPTDISTDEPTKTPPPPTAEPTKTPDDDDDDDEDDDKKCDKGEGNGGEDCDPGNNPDNGNDDENGGGNGNGNGGGKGNGHSAAPTIVATIVAFIETFLA